MEQALQRGHAVGQGGGRRRYEVSVAGWCVSLKFPVNGNNGLQFKLIHCLPTLNLADTSLMW